jgi:hypothetical protein
VDPALAARFELEVLHHVREIDVGAVDTGLVQRVVQQPARRPHERPASQVLLVTGLLAHQDDARVRVPLAEDGLRRVPVERARGASGGLPAERLERRHAVLPGHGACQPDRPRKRRPAPAFPRRARVEAARAGGMTR